MTAPLPRVFFDACTLENFAAVDRLDLLRVLYEGRCAWMDGVELDIRRGARERPHLQALMGAAWLGTPVAIEDPTAVQRVDRIRRGLGGSTRLPTQHLGEAQVIYHIAETELDAVFATDDRDAWSLARRRGIQVIDTTDIVARCYTTGLLGCPEAYELLQKMIASGRGAAVPESHWYVCPPAARPQAGLAHR